MASRIIINNTTNLNDFDALCEILKVVTVGKVSQTGKYKHYCHATRLKDNYVVTSTTRNGKTFTFDILKESDN